MGNKCIGEVDIFAAKDGIYVSDPSCYVVGSDVVKYSKKSTTIDGVTTVTYIDEAGVETASLPVGAEQIDCDDVVYLGNPSAGGSSNSMPIAPNCNGDNAALVFDPCVLAKLDELIPTTDTRKCTGVVQAGSASTTLHTFNTMDMFMAGTGWNVDFSPSPRLPASHSGGNSELVMKFENVSPLPAGAQISIVANMPLTGLAISYESAGVFSPAARQPLSPATASAGETRITLPAVPAGVTPDAVVLIMSSETSGSVTAVSIVTPESAEVTEVTNAALVALDYCTETFLEHQTAKIVAAINQAAMDNIKSVVQYQAQIESLANGQSAFYDYTMALDASKTYTFSLTGYAAYPLVQATVSQQDPTTVRVVVENQSGDVIPATQIIITATSV